MRKLFNYGMGVTLGLMLLLSACCQPVHAENAAMKGGQVQYTEKYPFSARVFVPGMAQIHKGQVGKGVGFIVGEAAFIGGIVAGECLRQSYNDKILRTHSYKIREYYADKANICTISRDVAIAGAVALYVWNVLDGVFAKGKTRIAVGEAQLRFAPYVTPEAGGLAMSIKF